MSIKISDPQARYRHEKRNTAIIALTDLDLHDAATICVVFLDQIAAGSPGFDLWGDIRADAAFWADCAHPAELEAYFSAALKRLPNQILGIRARKRLLAGLFQSLGGADQKAFINWTMEFVAK